VLFSRLPSPGFSTSLQKKFIFITLAYDVKAQYYQILINILIVFKNCHILSILIVVPVLKKLTEFFCKGPLHSVILIKLKATID